MPKDIPSVDEDEFYGFTYSGVIKCTCGSKVSIDIDDNGWVEAKEILIECPTCERKYGAKYELFEVPTKRIIIE